MNRRILAPIFVAVTCLSAVTLLMLGCQKQPRPAGKGPAAGGVTSKQDHLSLAMDYLGRLEEFDTQKGMLQTAYHLNRWTENLDKDLQWREDPMIADLPANLREIPPLKQLSKDQFTTEEMLFLREASWMQSISEWILQQTTELGIGDWLKQVEESRGEPHAYELAVAARLFDWTVRNIQLDELLPYPNVDGDGEASDGISPLMKATAGPGYTTHPWQTLMFGRGDAWQRARVFIQLARQRQIDVVLLALDDDAQTPRHRPWLPAALIDDQLYLFDAELGLPIPGPDGVGVATLEQVRKDKSLLTELEVGSAYPYVAAKADLDKVVALIDAAPDSLSCRMKLLESHVATGQRLVLSVNPSGLAERLRQCDGISDVDLWHTPFETWVYRKALDRWVEQKKLSGPETEEDSVRMRRLMLDEWIFDDPTLLDPTLLPQGRQLHLRGKFENEDRKQGAKAKYFTAREPDADIDRIETSPEIQKRMGLVRDEKRESDLEWQVRLQIRKMVITRAKRNASYWLGLIHYETGRLEPALEWLKTRTIEAAEAGPWTGGARYNLSRVYEAMGDLQKARSELLLDDSPQKHGNLLRARFLREKLEAQEADTSAEN